MSGRNSSATDRALELVAGGMTGYKAAQTTGIAFKTMYAALKRQREANALASLDPAIHQAPEEEPPAI